MKTVINENVTWDNELKLVDQSEQAQAWYNENIAPLLSWSVPNEIKQEAVDRLGLHGKIVEDTKEPEKISPSIFDRFARPEKWKFYFSDYQITITNHYMLNSENWNMDYIKVNIEKNGSVI